MGPFRRRSRNRPEPVQDDDLPLDVDRAARLRALVREVFAEEGREVVVHSDHLEDDQGAKFGLWNLAAVCAEAEEKDWPDLVRGHVSGLLTPDDLDALTDAELLVSTYLRIIEAAQMPQPGWHPTADWVGDDTLVVLAIDRPGQVATPPESYWDGRGGVEHWHKVGRTNLQEVLTSADLQHERVEPPDGIGGFEVVMGESFFTASLALVLDDVRARFTPDQGTGHGVLVCVPFRHQLAWCPVEPGGPALVALDNLFGFAAAGFSDAPGPVSPHVYWVGGGQWRQLTGVDEAGLGRIEVDEHLARVLGLTED